MSKGNLPLVSIVVPAYNHGEYVRDAIQSVLDQDYPNIELIVIDDGSTDNTREILEEFGDKFRWETQPNAGQARTLNRGWSEARGELLGYLSADDVLLPGAVSTSVRHLLADPEIVLTYCNYNLLDSQSRIIRRVEAPRFDYREMIVKFVCPPGPGVLFRRSAFEATGFWDDSLRLILDYEYWIRLALQGRFLKIPEVLAGFRVHEGSQTFARADERKSEEYVRVLSDYFRSNGVPPEIRSAKDEALSNAYIFAASSHFRSARYGKGVSMLFKGLYLYPKNLSIRTTRVILYGLLNRVRHRLRRGTVRTSVA